MLDPLLPRNPNNGVDYGSIPTSDEKFLSSENMLKNVKDQCETRGANRTVKNLMIKNTSSLQPTQILVIKKHSVKLLVVLKTLLEKHWERDNMGSSEEPSNLKRVKISMV